MSERYEKRQTYEFCEICGLMVRLDVIQATVRVQDYVHAEVRLVPVDCNRAENCKEKNIRCIVFDRGGKDPCPDAWKDSS